MVMKRMHTYGGDGGDGGGGLLSERITLNQFSTAVSGFHIHGSIHRMTNTQPICQQKYGWLQIVSGAEIILARQSQRVHRSGRLGD